MAVGPTPLVLGLIAVVLVCPPVAYFAYRTAPKPGARPAAVLLVATAAWGAGALLAGMAEGVGASGYWLAVSYAGVVITALAWSVLVLEHTGNGHLVTDRSLAVLSVEPLAVTAAVWTGGGRDLFWDGLAPAATVTGVTPGGYGGLYWVHAVYTALLAVVGAAVLLGDLRDLEDPDLQRLATLGVGAVAPLVGPVVTASAPGGIEFTPAAFALSGFVLLYASRRYELMRASPVTANTVVEHIDAGVVVLDREDRVTEINPSAVEVLGLEGESVVGRHASEVFGVYPGLYDRYADVNRASEEIGLDDGVKRRFFHVRVSPLLDARDRRAGRLVLIHDITNQKRRQQELARQNDRLDQFASLVSHDLRNPLNVADGYVELARETGEVSNLDRVERAHGRMRSLIEDVLTLAREGGTVTETEAVSIDEIAAEAWGNVDTGQAVLDVETGIYVEASYGRLLRVFENLFRNSVEHGSTGSRPEAGDSVEHDSTGSRPEAGDSLEHAGSGVRIRVGAIEPEGTVYVPAERGFFVADDGPGIPEDRRDRVFEDGFSTDDDGTGLGLSIVTSIVEAHGWSIAVTASEDGGARFEITGVEVVDPDRERQQARPGDD